GGRRRHHEPRDLVRDPHGLPPGAAGPRIRDRLRCADPIQRRSLGAGPLARRHPRHLPLQERHAANPRRLLGSGDRASSRGVPQMTRTTYLTLVLLAAALASPNQAAAETLTFADAPIGALPQGFE